MKPLSRTFANRSVLSRRGLSDVPAAEQCRELVDELAKRRQLYPGFVAKGTMKQDAAAHHIAVWRAICADIEGASGQGANIENGGASGHGWEAKVRELRRELALRRTAYPKWIESRTHPLTAGEAGRKLECLDAVHWLYWGTLFAFTPAGADPREDLERLHFIAAREADALRDRANRKPAQGELIGADAARDEAAGARQGDIELWQLVARLIAAERDGVSARDIIATDQWWRIADRMLAWEYRAIAQARAGAPAARITHIADVSAWTERRAILWAGHLRRPRDPSDALMESSLPWVAPDGALHNQQKDAA